MADSGPRPGVAADAHAGRLGKKAGKLESVAPLLAARGEVAA